MSRFPEPGRLAAHVLSDAVTAIDYEADGEPGVSASDLAYQRLIDIDGAIVADFDVSGSNLNLDLSNVLGASLITIEWLLARLATARGVDREFVAFELREYLDS